MRIQNDYKLICAVVFLAIISPHTILAAAVSLTVNNGTGSGSYEPGTAVTITGIPPTGQVFDKWTVISGSPTVANVNSQSTILTMPATAVTVTASFKAFTVIRVSTDSNGNQANGDSGDSYISADGTKVVFSSSATNLVAGDTNGFQDIFVKDLVTGVTTRVSTSSAGVQGNGDSTVPNISADGTKVSFQSNASNLVPGDTNALSDVFVKDLVTGVTTRVSTDSNGGQGNDQSWLPSLSADGTKVAFESFCTNFAAGIKFGRQIFVKNLITGAIIQAYSVVDTSGNNDCHTPSLNADGTKLAFQSWLSPNGDWWYPQVYVKNLTTGAVTLVSSDSNGTVGDYYSYNPSISADGKTVAFFSESSNLVTGDYYGKTVYVKDLTTGVTKRVCTDNNGTVGNGYSTIDNPRCLISADGKKVLFGSIASNLVNGDTNSTWDAFLKDFTTGTTTRISTNGLGVVGNTISSEGSITPDGMKVTFESRASNLVPGDTNGVFDIFFINLKPNPTPEISSAAYNATSGVLSVTTATVPMTVGDAIAVNKLTLSGEGGASYTLTSPNVTATSSISFTVTLNAVDKAAVNQFMNKNGTTSTGGAVFNLAAADDWEGSLLTGDSSDSTSPVTVSNVPVPTITSATYDASTGILVVTGTGFLKLNGAANDIDISKLAIKGEGGTTYALTTPSVDITSDTSFSVILNDPDWFGLMPVLNLNGTLSSGGSVYNLAGAEDWASGADPSVVVADLAGNGITVSHALYSLTVNNGSYSGLYEGGSLFYIFADAPPAGQVFDKWVINSGAPMVFDIHSPMTMLGMPTNAVSVTATFKTSYPLTVNSGSGSGNYGVGDIVPISANDPPPGQTFLKWVVDFGAPLIVDELDPMTSLFMTPGAASVTATYQPAYTLTVNHGTWSGEYPAGAVVNIYAEVPSPGFFFTGWEVNSGSPVIADIGEEFTTLVMPPEAVSITATYARIQFQLTVTNGTGTGPYPWGTSVPINAIVPPGQMFDKWVINSGAPSIANPNVTPTVLTMPMNAAQVTATFKPIPQPDINVKGNGIKIFDGDITPAAADFTDFGLLKVGTGSLTRQFTIENLGNVVLNLTGGPRVTIIGPNAADFTVTVFPAASVNVNGNTTFQLKFIPGGVGLRTATVSIASDDPDENPYTFRVQGFGNTAPGLGSGPWANPNPVVISSNTVLDVNATDNDGPNALTYAWSVSPGAPGTVSFAPGANIQSPSATFSAPGTYTLNVSVFDGLDTATGSVQVVVQAPAIAVAVTNGSTSFGSQVLGTSSLPATFTVTNTGLAPLTVSSLALGGTNPGQFILGALTPAGPIAAGGTATFTASFTPNTLGAKTAVINIGHDGRNTPSPFVINLNGTGVPTPPTTMTVADANGVFNNGDVATGVRALGATVIGVGSPVVTFTINNTGASALVISSLSLSGGNPGQFTLGALTPSGPIAAGGSATFTARFMPDNIGPKSAAISFTHNAGNMATPFVINLSGNAVTSPPTTMTVADSNGVINNGDVASGPRAFGATVIGVGSAPLTFTINNTGASALAISGLSLGGGNPGQFTLGALTPSGPIAVGGSATFTARFTPDNTGAKSATVNIGHNAGNTATPFVINLSGNAVTAIPTTMTVADSGGAINNGDAATGPRAFGATVIGVGSAPLTFTINNTGASTLTISGLSMGGGNPGQFILGALTPAGPIAAGGSATFNARFMPDNTGAKSAAISFTHNAGNTATPFVINLSGNAVTSPPTTMTVSDSSGLLSNPAAATGPRAFGSTVIGVGSAPLAFTINNTGPSPLTISGLSLGGGNPGQFTLGALTPSGSIAAGGSATFTARFTPDNTGAKSAVVSFTHNAGNTATPFTINLSGNAVTAIPTTITVADSGGTINNGDAATGPRAFGSTVIGVGSSPLTFTINNTGASALTISGLALGGANPGQFTLGSLTPSGPIAAGGSATFTARFTPDNTGAKSAAVSFTHNAGNTATPFVINLSGNAVTSPPTTMTVSDSSGLLSNPAAASGPRAFGSIVIGVGSSPLTFTINNTGPSALTVSGLSLGGTNPGQFTLGALTPSGPIASGGSATFTARFTPDNTGAKSAVINFTHNAGNTATPFVINLSGNAVTTIPTTLTVADSNGVFNNGDAATGLRAFGIQTVGTSSSVRTFTITNTGASTLTITGLMLNGTNPGQFTLGALTPAGPIAASGTATFTVKFSPNNPGPKVATVEFGHNGSNTTTPFVINMSGTAQ